MAENHFRGNHVIWGGLLEHFGQQKEVLWGAELPPEAPKRFQIGSKSVPLGCILWDQWILLSLMTVLYEKAGVRCLEEVEIEP